MFQEGPFRASVKYCNVKTNEDEHFVVYYVWTFELYAYIFL